MRTLSILKKSLRQQLRDWFGTALSTFTASFFVLLYWMFFSVQPVTDNVLIFDQDVTSTSTPETVTPRRELINAVIKLTSSHGTHSSEITFVDDLATLKTDLMNGKAVAGIIVPPLVSPALSEKKAEPVYITVMGDATLPSYHITSALVQRALDGYIHERTGVSSLMNVVEKPLGLSNTRTSFELYVPGLLVFAVIMLIFSASLAVAKEVEGGTLVRIRMTPIRTLELMAGMSLAQLIQGLLSVLLTFLTAQMLGFQSAGSITPAFFLAGIACFASVGVGMIVASLSRTMVRAFLISSVAMFLLILFSGVIFPRPEVTLFHLGGHSIGLVDFLPTTHMKVGLDKILTLGATWSEVGYELTLLSVLSIIYFGGGMLIFNRSCRFST